MVDNKTKELAVLAKDAYEEKTKLNNFQDENYFYFG